MSFNQDIAEQYGLTVRESDAPNREKIDFSVYDSDIDDNVAWAWGSGDTVAVDNKEYNYDYEVECTHPNIEYEDDETQGYCPICGKYCDWHYSISADDGYTIKERTPHQWHEGDGGIIKEYIKQFERKENVCE